MGIGQKFACGMTTFLAVLNLLILSCSGSRHEVKTANSPDGAGSPSKLLENPRTVGYQIINEKIFRPYCLECHQQDQAKDGIDLSSYDKIMKGAQGRTLIRPFTPGDSLVFSVLKISGSRHMPPLSHPQLSLEETELLKIWIERGAPFEINTEVEKPASLKEQLVGFFNNPDLIDYQVVEKYVLAPYCVKCHSLTGSSPDENAIAYSANLTDYQSLFNQFAPVVVKGDPEKSKLFRSMAITQSMPPAKDGYEPVDSLQIKILRLWIENCAPEKTGASEKIEGVCKLN